MGIAGFSFRGFLIRLLLASAFLGFAVAIAAAPFVAAFLWGAVGLYSALAVLVAFYVGLWWGRDGDYYRGAVRMALDRLPP